jgi:hypothetical protein
MSRETVVDHNLARTPTTFGQRGSKPNTRFLLQDALGVRRLFGKLGNKQVERMHSRQDVIAII